MITSIEPSVTNGFASTASESAYPHLWEGLTSGLFVIPHGGKQDGKTINDVTRRPWSYRFANHSSPVGIFGGRMAFNIATTSEGVVSLYNGVCPINRQPLYGVGTGPFSVSLWTYGGSDTTAVTLWRHDDGPNFVLRTIFNSRTRVEGLGTTVGGTDDTFLLLSGEWQHWVVTRRGSNCYLYLNGIALANNTDATTSIAPTISTDINIGATSISSERMLDAGISDVLWYRRALSDSDIKLLYEDHSAPFRLSTHPIGKTPVQPTGFPFNRYYGMGV